MYSIHEREINECFKMHYGLLVQRCHHCILIQALWMCQETRASPATQTADTEELLPTDPWPTRSLPFPPRYQRYRVHYRCRRTQRTWQLKSNIQSVTYTLNREAKWKVLRKLEFQTLVSESVTLPCITIPPMTWSLHCSPATKTNKNVIRFLTLTKETPKLLPSDLGH